MVEIKNIYKQYGGKTILNDINFTINSGEIAVIYGVNGAGKTTLIKCMIDLIKYDGVVKLIPNDKNQIGIYLGHEVLIEKLKVSEYLYLAGHLKNLSKEEIKNKINTLADKLNFIEHLNDLISNVSFGTKTKVLLAASVINSPKLLILDEPFTGLDLIIVDEVVALLKELKKDNCTIFISSHQVNILEDIIDKIFILKNKEIIYNGSVNKNTDLTNFVLSYLK
ncbi:ABC transporter ATP-binding protein [Flavobacterium jejuense]|uniref:ABC transporter ATP-binding protein n=1 Tax=Flavobacterium jejuense TaxID=1544455 RepID=A0ABX0J092_9FLAO|nr:ABC transporter ATP-binding protein [Flavobacterium jejuense]NHN27375.1 ABC transporter ATP-binding protein [Flavobacterium jejuense]